MSLYGPLTCIRGQSWLRNASRAACRAGRPTSARTSGSPTVTASRLGAADRATVGRCPAGLPRPASRARCRDRRDGPRPAACRERAAGRPRRRPGATAYRTPARPPTPTPVSAAVLGDRPRRHGRREASGVASPGASVHAAARRAARPARRRRSTWPRRRRRWRCGSWSGRCRRRSPSCCGTCRYCLPRRSSGTWWRQPTSTDRWTSTRPRRETPCTGTSGCCTGSVTG
jgi:hypothetical protein